MGFLESSDVRGRRNMVNVRWSRDRKNVYRLAYEGHVDITCLEEEVGGFYYRDHLPVLGNVSDFLNC
jgi:E3 ubiquitin-protein ligase mind-bomb